MSTTRYGLTIAAQPRAARPLSHYLGIRAARRLQRPVSQPFASAVRADTLKLIG
jgi:hypothetical protein